MTEELAEVQQKSLTEAEKDLVARKTPEQYIKQRKGRGGRTFNYVEVGYVIDQLNEIFNFMWDFEIVEEKVGKEQIWVKGKLTCHPSPDFALTKTAYGGKDISRYKESNEIIDIADDLKAAASDALKKCASLVGIASDVYWPGGNGESEKSESEKKNGYGLTSAQRGKIFALGDELEYDSAETKRFVKKACDVESFNDITVTQASKVIDIMQERLEDRKKDEKVEPDEIPDELMDSTVPF